MNQTGSINGTVMTSDGSVLPAVMIELRSPALVVEKLTVLSNESGQYRLVNLSPGTYDITFILDGMKTMARKGIRVNVGVATSLSVVMEMGDIRENIEVSGQAPTVDVQTTAKTSNVTTELINAIPLGRTIADIFTLVPGVTNGTAHGSSVRSNSWAIDGVNVNDPVVGTQNVTISTDVLEEVAVTVGGIGAEYANATGAVINAVTKSGGNTFSGTASFHYNHESFKGDNTTDTVLEGQSSGDKFRLNPSFTLGGPLLKNKLWFLASFELTNRESYVSGYPLGATEETPTDNRMYNIYGKLTFQPGQNDKFYFSYQYGSTKLNHRFADYNVPESWTVKHTSPSQTMNLQWTHTFSNAFFMNLKAAGVLYNMDLLAKGEGASIYHYERDEYEGYFGTDDINTRNKLQIDGDFTLFIDDFIGTHEWKAGFNLGFAYDNWKLNYKGPTDAMGFRASDIWLYDGDPLLIVYRKNLDQSQKTRVFSFFLQDTWTPTSKLVFNLGVRIEKQMGIIPKQNENAVGGYFLPEFFGDYYPFNDAVTGDMTVADWFSVSPRIGMSYDLTGDGRTVLKASYGRYYNALATQWFNGFNPNAQSLYYGSYDPENMQVYELQGYYLPESTKPKWKNYELKNPYTDEITISMERELFEDWSLGLRGIYKVSKNILEDVDANSLDVDTLLETGELVWKNWTPKTTTDPLTGNTVRFWEKQRVLAQDMYSINAPGESSKYTALEVNLKKRFSRGWMVEASYVYSENKGLFDTSFNATTSITGYYNSPDMHENAIGKLESNRPHYFKLFGMLKGPLGINISGVYRYYSGNRYSRFASNVDLGVSLRNVSSQMIRVSERGEFSLPEQSILDLRLEKQFKFGTLSWAVFADCFNVFNQGVATTAYTNDYKTIPFGQMTAISDPRVFRLGTRIEF
jgi:uncharacterized protein YneR